MIAVAGPRLAVIDSEWTGDAQHAGHDQGALDPGGDAREVLPVHAASVPKAQPTGVTLGGSGDTACESHLDTLHVTDCAPFVAGGSVLSG